MSANVFAAQVGPAGQGAGRPAVLSLSIKEKAALYAAFMPFVKSGGIFVPTNRPYQLGDEVYLILTLLDDPTKIPVAGKSSGSARPGAAPPRHPGSACSFRPTIPDSAPASGSRTRSERRCGPRARPTRFRALQVVDGAASTTSKPVTCTSIPTAICRFRNWLPIGKGCWSGCGRLVSAQR